MMETNLHETGVCSYFLNKFFKDNFIVWVPPDANSDSIIVYFCEVELHIETSYLFCSARFLYSHTHSHIKIINEFSFLLFFKPTYGKVENPKESKI